MADETPVSFITLSDIQSAASADLLEGVSTAPAGSIYFPDTILAAKVEDLDGAAGQQLESWKRTHRFFIVPFSIGIRPTGNNIPESVDIALSLEAFGGLAQRPLILGVFPPNGFKKGPFEGSLGVELGADGSLQSVATAKANVAFNYTYAPAYADVAAGFASGHAFWTYRRSQESYPIGDIPMKLVLVVPATYPEDAVVARFDVRVDFGGTLFWDKSAQGYFSSVIELPA
ncbi:MAG: hypothetical protein AAGF74_05865 [Pseudomonadota bacterium]